MKKNVFFRILQNSLGEISSLMGNAIIAIVTRNYSIKNANSHTRNIFAYGKRYKSLKGKKLKHKN